MINDDLTRVPLPSPLIGSSPVMQRIREFIDRIATSDISVTIQGPSGAGKEVVANAIHQASRRSGKFVALNVSGIAETLFEDALFGHVRGGFTNALTDHTGYFQEAHDGTLFMDEIGQLRLANQSTLLRAIETKVFRPVGGKRDCKSDFRLISATNENLPQLVADGQFRIDLFHRLRALVVVVPALSEHLEDIPELVAHLLGQLADVRRDFEVTRGALERLRRYSWPGNVRELKSVVHSASYMTDGNVIDANTIEVAFSVGAGVMVPEYSIHRRRREELIGVLNKNSCRVEDLAMHFGVTKTTVYRWLKYYGIPTPERYRPTRAVSA